MGTEDEERRKTLGRLVRRRRAALRQSQGGLATSQGMSPDTWRKVEEGALVRGLSYAKVENALDWPPGSIEAYLAGTGHPPGEPTRQARRYDGGPRVHVLLDPGSGLTVIIPAYGRPAPVGEELARIFAQMRRVLREVTDDDGSCGGG